MERHEKVGFRVSVRELVEFSYFPEDILPSTGDMEELWIGAKAHQARQKQLDGETEKALRQRFCCLGEPVTLYGRMDAFTQGADPLVEEMKLCRRESLPKEVIPGHRAQALCYAAMAAVEQGAAVARFRVTYMDELGQVRIAFEERHSRERLTLELHGMLVAYMAYAIAERDYRKRRDATLAALVFPFPRYREGQREMAAQVFTAILRKRRLFASLPTGTGKSAAVLFPALKALGEGRTGKILYLTMRTTARQSPLNTLEQLRRQGMHARVMTLSAKEKMCPGYARCHPTDCPRAQGHYLRQGTALEEFREAIEIWTDERILEAADRHRICPFELGLAMAELADVVLLDANYAFDPFAQLKRLFRERRDLTILADEAHHLAERMRENLSGEMDSAVLQEERTAFGKVAGRKHPYYKALGKAVDILRSLELEISGDEGSVREDMAPPGQASLSAEKEGVLKTASSQVVQAIEGLAEAVYGLMASPAGYGRMESASAILRLCGAFLYASEHLDEDYAILLRKKGRERVLELYCLLPAKEICRVTKRIRGTVFFSATMAPLSATKLLLGGEEEDACFSLPSPFPPMNLTVIRRRIDTRYTAREETAESVAKSIVETALLRPGKYIAYFPSYAYLRLVQPRLEEMAAPPLCVQTPDMSEPDRAVFMEAFTQRREPILGLCVLGSLFSEGIDLPGDQLIGVIIVGVGLPAPSLRLRVVQDCYHRHFGDGFGYACRIPGMHKVLQAAGRVIRTETDRGIVVLLDERYYQHDYASLLPEHWRFRDERMEAAVARREET
ncbi:MAG: ATP-dependent DNA helicase [Clostridia bacterium]|nr:ATP-dependent DNA helicase [Clostridia bacterium]